MKRLFLPLLFVCAVALSGCTGNKAAELLETAKFEELQNNKEHAIKLYREIVEKHPGSDEAKNAEKRLAELRAVK